MLRIIIISVATVLLALADGPVLKTGQVNSYDVNGDIVTDGSIKDDGYYRTGKPVSYTSGNDLVTDVSTGLLWQDDESIKKPWVTKDNYEAGNYFDTSGDTAATYCSDLLLIGGGWRLPTIQELKSLVDYGQHDPSITPDLFNNINHEYLSKYWSSTTAASTTAAPTTYDLFARTVTFYDGSVGNVDKDWNYNVRCVQDGNMMPSNLSRDESSKIVTDWTTGLQWQDDESADTTRLSWEEAIDYCENTLTLGGWLDWRMPNANELFSIMDHSRRDPAIDTSVFVNTDISLTTPTWTSTTNHSATEKAWGVYFGTGLFLSGGTKTFTYNVRCVRGGEGGPSGNGAIVAIISTYLLL